MFEESGGERGVPPLTDDMHVHLAVLTPGIPGLRVEAQDFEVEGKYGRSENIAGVYQEWDIPPDAFPFGGDVASQAPGTWRWPERV